MQFRPHPLVPTGNLQTIMAHLSGTKEILTADRTEIIQLVDGDQIACDINDPLRKDGDGVAFPQGSLADRKMVAVIGHGLGGCSESSYVQRLAHKLRNCGVQTVRINHRGFGRSRGLVNSHVFHSGRHDDILEVVRWVSRVWPDSSVALVGFSLSGAMMLNLLGRHRDAALLKERLHAAVAICPPVDLELCSRQLDARQNYIYNYYITLNILRQSRSNGREFPEIGKHSLLRPARLREFDAVYTAPMGGFASRSDYYQQCSAKHHLEDIKVPTLILTADDDPLVPPASFENVTLGTSVAHWRQPGGGHLGFISGTRTVFGDYRWMDAAVARWLGVARPCQRLDAPWQNRDPFGQRGEKRKLNIFAR